MLIAQMLLMGYTSRLPIADISGTMAVLELE